MPARSEYDREPVFEQAEFYARRHGTVRLELDRREMLISRVTGQATRPCGHCGERDAGLSCGRGGGARAVAASERTKRKRAGARRSHTSRRRGRLTVGIIRSSADSFWPSGLDVDGVQAQQARTGAMNS
jgi:hypothetical protein